MPNPNPKTEQIEGHQFKPGQSGNPKGRRKGSLNVKTRIKYWVGTSDKIKTPDGTEQKVDLLDSMILGLIKKARNGDAYAFEILMNRLEGRVADRVVLAGDVDAPIINESRSDIDYSKLSTAALKEVAAARRHKHG